MRKWKKLFIAAALFAPASVAQNGLVDRGRYLVEEVAHCQVCHSKRQLGAAPDRAVWLKGGTADGQYAPDITSGGEVWKAWGERGMTQFLRTGRDPAGKSAQMHMPPYRLRPDDADAITAYLRSLR